MADREKGHKDKGLKDAAADDPGMVTPAMSLEQIEDAGLMVDMPFESPPGAPARMRYADLGEGKAWKAPEGFTIAGIPYAEVVANVGGGHHTEGAGGGPE